MRAAEMSFQGVASRVVHLSALDKSARRSIMLLIVRKMRTTQCTLQLDSCHLSPGGSARPHDRRQKVEQTLPEASLVAYSVRIPGLPRECLVPLDWFVSCQEG